jgi:16S rRNA G966 N2-methylase RsmD
MNKGKINITIDTDLIEYMKGYAQEQRTSVSEIISQFILNLKRVRENDPTDIILSDPDFSKSLFQAIEKIKTGKAKWHRYDEVFS